MGWDSKSEHRKASDEERIAEYYRTCTDPGKRSERGLGFRG